MLKITGRFHAQKGVSAQGVPLSTVCEELRLPRQKAGPSRRLPTHPVEPVQDLHQDRSHPGQPTLDTLEVYS